MACHRYRFDRPRAPRRAGWAAARAAPGRRRGPRGRRPHGAITMLCYTLLYYTSILYCTALYEFTIRGRRRAGGEGRVEDRAPLPQRLERVADCCGCVCVNVELRNQESLQSTADVYVNAELTTT